MDRLQSFLRAHDGVARTGTLARHGVTRGAIERAVAAGSLIRVRRGWVADPRADPHVLAAARDGVVVTCITRARMLGLWVLAEDRPHVAARPHAGRAPVGSATVHWSTPAVPRHPDSVLDRIENTLIEVAGCQPYEAALVVWDSALRQGLVEKQALARLDVPPAARRLLDDADPFADSGLETLFVPRLRWLGLRLRRQIWISGHRVDLLIGERLVLQIDGGHHVGRQREEDIAHDAALMLLGYHVIRVGYAQVVERWHEVQELIMQAVAQGLHRAAY
jgi:very-short-patch-repair endonuclease